MAHDAPDSPDIVVCSSSEALYRDAAHRFTSLAQQAASEYRDFSVALAGGRTPAALYQALATAPYAGSIPWHRVHLFFGDDRHVPISSEFSNYRMTRDSLIAPLGLSENNVHRIRTESESIDEAVNGYRADLAAFFGNDALPRFDLVLLGMGPDGHCASLFPHKPALKIEDQWVVASEPGMKPEVARITITFPVINAARNVLFLVTGGDKAQTLKRVLDGPYDPETLPSQSVRPSNGFVTWLIERSAAAEL